MHINILHKSCLSWWNTLTEHGYDCGFLSAQANTYQAIAITDGVTHSYAVFIYECGGVQWGGDAVLSSVYARVGISIGGDVLISHPLSGNESVDNIDCLNDPNSQWVNLVYDLSLIKPSTTTAPVHSTKITSLSPVSKALQPTESGQVQ